MEGIRTIHIEVSSDGDFFSVLKKSVVDYMLALDLSKTACAAVEKETEKLFKEDLSKLVGSRLTLEVSAEESRVVLRARDDRDIAEREVPIA